MRILFRKFALLALLLVIPLQGMAAVVGPLMCSSGGHHSTAAAADADHGYGGSDHQSAHNHTGDTTSSGDAAGHLGCHHAFFGIPVSFEPLVRSDLPVFQTTLSLLATLHIPELPQRPPRA